MISIVDNIKELKKAGADDSLAETIARQQEQLRDTIKHEQMEELEKKQLVTKYDLQKEVNKILYVYGAGFVFLLGAIAKGFGWF